MPSQITTEPIDPPPRQQPAFVNKIRTEIAASVGGKTTMDKVKLGLGAGAVVLHFAFAGIAYLGLKYPKVTIPSI
jgi:hypothetical protein